MNAVETWVKSYIGILKAGSDGIRGKHSLAPPVHLGNSGDQ